MILKSVRTIYLLADDPGMGIAAGCDKISPVTQAPPGEIEQQREVPILDSKSRNC